MMRLVGRSNKVGHLSSPDRDIDRQVTHLDIGQCFADGFGVLKKHPVLLLSVSVVTVLLCAASGMLLIGSLYAGLLLMLVKAMDGKRPALGDLFARMKRFPGFFLVVVIGLMAILSGIVLALFPFVLGNWHAVLLDGRMAYSARFEVLVAQLLETSPGFRLAFFSLAVGAFYVFAPRVFLGVRCFYLLCLAADRGLPVDEVYVVSKRAVQKYGFRPHVLLMLMEAWLVFLSVETFALLSASFAGMIGSGALLIVLQPFLLGLCASAYRQTLRVEAHQHRLHAEEVVEMRDELQTARDMQLSLLPSENPNVTGYDLADICIPANAVCGDYYTYRWLDDRHFALIVADVCGKAMKAAVTAVRFNEMLRYECRQRTDATEILAGLDAALEGQVDDLTFITCCVAVRIMPSSDLAALSHLFPPMGEGKRMNNIIKALLLSGAFSFWVFAWVFENRGGRRCLGRSCGRRLDGRGRFFR